jgi:hypothetical protein
MAVGKCEVHGVTVLSNGYCLTCGESDHSKKARAKAGGKREGAFVKLSDMRRWTLAVGALEERLGAWVLPPERVMVLADALAAGLEMVQVLTEAGVVYDEYMDAKAEAVRPEPPELPAVSSDDNEPVEHNPAVVTPVARRRGAAVIGK